MDNFIQDAFQIVKNPSTKLIKPKYIINPDKKGKIYWNTLVIISMIFSIVIAPIEMAFDDVDSALVLILSTLCDTIFFFDIILTFFTAYYDEDKVLIFSHKEIIKNYLKTWLVPDIVACIPFNLIIEDTLRYNSLLKASRFKFLWRIIRVTKMLRLFKVITTKEDRIALKHTFKLTIQVERLLTSFFLIMFLIHIIACFWIFFGKNSENEISWIRLFQFENLTSRELYIVSFYWSVTTLTTVGYGDISATNDIERPFSVILMIIGIFCYSYIVSSISAIFSEIDSKHSKLNKKLKLLFNLSKEIKISSIFYSKLNFALKYEYSNNDKELLEISSFLPESLKQKLLFSVYSQKLEKNHFFNGKSMQFIAFVAPLLRPVKYAKKEIIYEAGEYANEMYFIVRGEVSFVVTSKGTRYSIVKVKDNYYFGETDIILSPLKTYLTSVQAYSNCDLLSFTRENFENMLEIFEDEAFEIMVMAQERLERIYQKMDAALTRIKKQLEPEAKYSAYYKREDFEKELVSFRKSICRDIRRSDSSLIGKLKRQKTPKTHLMSLKNKVKRLIIHTDHLADLSKQTLELVTTLKQV